MRRAIGIQQEVGQIHMVEDLTEVFEGIASMRIAKIRDRVVTSKDFFTQLWQIYSSLRIDPNARMRRDHHADARSAFVAVTSEGKLSGSIDEQIVAAMLAARQNPEQTDLITVGTHGLTQLRQQGLPVTRAFHMPPQDDAFNVTNVIEALAQYKQISVFYQTYESLRVQKVARIELLSAVRALGDDVDDTGAEVVSSEDYIFEPDLNEIADYMESVMMGVALIQVVMESKLAQYAGRFNAMSAAKHRANELMGDLQRQFYRAKRAEGDERLKEIMKVVKYHGKGAL